MAENINISFAPNKAASESQRIADLEQYVSTLTERTKFAFASIIDEYNDTANDKRTVNMIYQTASESGSDVGQFTTEYFSEIFNDYENNIATLPYSHAEGYRTSAKGLYSHAEGNGTVTSDNNAHAEGCNTEASDYSSHAEGEETKATGWASHAEGRNTIADGVDAHAEGGSTIARGNHSHAGGFHSEANAEYSFAHGLYVINNYSNGATFGRYNKTQDALFVVGNGSQSDKSDALTLNDIGELWVSGSIKSDGLSRSGMKGISVKGSARFGEYWTTDSITVLLAVGNGTDANHLQDALTLDNEGNLHISGKFTADGGVGYVLPTATAYTLGGVMIGDNISVTADGVISVNLSEYLKSGEISDWAKAESKPAYTADEVGAATSADITAAVSAVEIGGRNLLYYSRFDKKYPNAWAYSAVVTYAFDGNAATLTKAETTTRQFTTQASVSNGVVAANPNLLPENGCTYTISCEVMKAEGYDVGNGTKITNRYNFTDGTVKDFDVDVSGASETAWTKYSRTYTYASDKDVRYTQFIVALGAQACGIKIRNVKFEKGNKPTDWSPAPEDDERRIASLEARVAALEAAAVSGGE